MSYDEKWDERVQEVSIMVVQMCHRLGQPVTVLDVAEYLKNSKIPGSKSHEKVRQILEAGVNSDYLSVLRLRASYLFMPRGWGFGPLKQGE